MKKALFTAVFLVLLCLGIQRGTGLLLLQGQIQNLQKDAAEQSTFRWMEISPQAAEIAEKTAARNNCTIGRVLAVWLPQNHYRLSGKEELTEKNFSYWSSYFEYYREEELKELSEGLSAVWDDLVYFPVAHLEGEKECTFDNSWLSSRNYGGERGHEGTDIMPPQNRRGYYPIVSMTDGIVEKIGWLDKGGWRIGVRSSHGGYFYYAHLSSYAGNFKEGDTIKAGELLGYMGDSGYGKEEGTVGRFDVHLHLGIYIHTGHYEELSVNPYWVLRYLEERKLKYKYDL